jgi:hypothetical protein
MCGKETDKTLFRKALVHTYICSKECLTEYFKPLGGRKLAIQESIDKGIDERDYWIE